MADDAAMALALQQALGQDPSEFRAKFLEQQQPDVKACLETLYELHTERTELVKQFYKERAELEAKYRKLYAPFYNKRAEAINAQDGKGIPGFWLKAMQNNPNVAEYINEKDAKVLQVLEDIQEEDLPGNAGFTLKFVFQQPNSFFSEKVLEKTFWFNSEEEELELTKDSGCTISWASVSVNPTVKVMKRKPRPGQAAKGPMMKTVEEESFFNFFKAKAPEGLPDEDNEELDDAERQEAAEKLHVLENDFLMAEAIKEQILPNAVKWFTGEAMFEMMEDDDEYEDEDEEEFEGDDEDEDEDEEGEAGEGAVVPAGGPKKSKKKGKGQEQPPECKQQ